MGVRVGEGKRQAAAFLRLLAGDVEEERRVGDRIEDDHRPAGRVSDIAAFSPGASSMTSSVTLSITPARPLRDRPRSPRKPGACIRTAKANSGSCAAIRRILGFTVKVTSISSIERRLVFVGAERAEILGAIERLQRGARFEHAAAAGTDHVPGHVEEPEPSRMDESPDRRLFESLRAAAKASGLIRFSARSEPDSTSCSSLAAAP